MQAAGAGFILLSMVIVSVPTSFLNRKAASANFSLDYLDLLLRFRSPGLAPRVHRLLRS